MSSRVALAARLRRRDRQDRRDPQRPVVEPFEDDGAGRDRAGGREPERGHRIGELGGRVRSVGFVRIELAAKLEHEQPVDVASELRRHQALRLRPELRDLTRGDGTQRDAAAEVDVGACGETDDRRERDVRPVRAEERLLEVGVRGVERLVVPVEAAATLGGPRQHRQQDRPEERIVAGVADPGVGAREDRGRGLALQIVDRVARVGQPAQGRCLLLDEAADERAVLVERRACSRRVLLERERDLRAALGRERAEAEAAQRLVEMRCAKRRAMRAHVRQYAPRGLSPTWHVGHQYAMRLSSPCPHDRIRVRQRGHGRPTRR